MREKIKAKTGLALTAGLVFFTWGCNLGNAPAGASVEQIKAQVSKMPLADQAKIIMGGPGPIELKRQKVEQLYKNNGQTAPSEVLEVPTSNNGAPIQGQGSNVSPSSDTQKPKGI